MAIKWIKVKNPANGIVTQMSEVAFTNHFKAKGFTRVDDDVDGTTLNDDEMSAIDGEDGSGLADEDSDSESETESEPRF